MFPGDNRFHWQIFFTQFCEVAAVIISTSVYWHVRNNDVTFPSLDVGELGVNWTEQTRTVMSRIRVSVDSSSTVYLSLNFRQFILQRTYFIWQTFPSRPNACSNYEPSNAQRSGFGAWQTKTYICFTYSSSFSHLLSARVDRSSPNFAWW